MIERLRDEAQSLAEELIRWRRDFHRHPEIACQEHRTSAVIRQFLESLALQVRACAGTGLIGELQGMPGGKTIALRADMDALPLKEEGDKDYASENPGACHACGHDGHMAILMGAASLLSRRSGEFPGKIVFLFQPAEEKLPGGARQMIAEGALQDVDAIFGLHLWQGFPTGTVACLRGAMMASTDEFAITVAGKGGHGAMPQVAVDPILATSQLVVNLQSIVSRNVDPLQASVVTVGKIEGGFAHNIIPSQASIYGTVRTFDREIQRLIEKRIEEIMEGTCRIFGAKGILKYERGYPALVNNAAMSDLVLEVARRTLGAGCVQEAAPVMGGEDFAYYLQQVPGAFLFFGMGDGTEFPHHHPAFDIDERALPQATLLMSSLALEYLKK
ncbi:MAG: amidohydrolase [Acidobacteriia bacterium]|nr:amidohydrolase [Terriglobia bacterium]